MTNDPVLSDLQAMFQVQAARPDFRGGVSLTEDDVQRWIACSGASRSALYDEIAVQLARGFLGSELTFEFCDAVMNGIHGLITNAARQAA